MNGSFSTRIFVRCQNHLSGGLWQPFCCLLPWGKHGSGGCWLSLLSFPQDLCSLWLAGPSKVPGAYAAQQWPTLQVPSHPISPWCQNSSSSHARSRGFPVLHAALLLTLLLDLPWTCFPLACSSIEKMVVAKPSSEPRSTQSLYTVEASM